MNPLIVFIGFPGTGKSTSSKKIVNKLKNYITLNTCDTRRILKKTEYKEEDTPQVLAWMYSRTEERLKMNKGVILDSVYKSRRGRQIIYDIALNYFIPVLVIECTCKELTAKKRILGRPNNDGLHMPPNNAEVYDKYLKIWENVENDIGNNENTHVSIIKYDTEKQTINEIKVNEDLKELVSFIEKILV